MLKFPNVIERKNPVVVPNGRQADEYRVAQLETSTFHFPEGSKLIIRENFDVDEITPRTFVISNGGLNIGQAENATAIVDFIQIDLRTQ